MEKSKRLRLILIPIVVGLVVALIMRQILPSRNAQPAAGGEEQVEVVAVAGDKAVSARTRLTQEHLMLKAVPKSVLTGSELRTVEEAVGRITLVELQPGEIVIPSRLAEEETASLAYRIPQGMRAVTIRIDEFTGVAGHPVPGDLVDLIFVLPAKKPERPNATSRILYQSVPVLGKGLATVEDGRCTGGDCVQLSSLTLALKPDAAAEVALAEQIGLLKVTLRPAVKEGDVKADVVSESRY